MSAKRYNIEFSGKVIPGWSIDEVKANLSKSLKADEETLYKLFSGSRFVIKKNVDHQTAIKINNVLKKAGADCMITPAEDSRTTAPPPIPAHSEPGQPGQIPTAGVKPSMGPSEIRPKKFWYVVAVLLFLVPMMAGGITIFNTIRSTISDGTALSVPGETIIRAEIPGSYYIFYETSVFNEMNVVNNLLGRDFNIMIKDLATGEQLQLHPSKFNGTETYGARVRQAIAEVEIDTSGDYYAVVTGELPERDGLLIRRLDLVGIIKDIVSAFVLFFLGFIAGLVMALVVFVKRQNNKNKQLNEPMSENEERKWAMFAHIGTFSSLFVPLGNIVAPIVIWQIKKNESAFIVEQAKESLNFQMTVSIGIHHRGILPPFWSDRI